MMYRHGGGIVGTLPGALRVPQAATYQCSRCGIVRPYNGARAGRRPPDKCADCQAVLREIARRESEGVAS